ncbi:hypothetical protein EI94DRAFT_1914808 [Lactarius quietus]|nr:hypothetical protein EI94DRAFT_1914808 [Lactarius quietus]
MPRRKGGLLLTRGYTSLLVANYRERRKKETTDLTPKRMREEKTGRGEKTANITPLNRLLNHPNTKVTTSGAGAAFAYASYRMNRSATGFMCQYVRNQYLIKVKKTQQERVIEVPLPALCTQPREELNRPRPRTDARSKPSPNSGGGSGVTRNEAVVLFTSAPLGLAATILVTHRWAMCGTPRRIAILDRSLDRRKCRRGARLEIDPKHLEASEKMSQPASGRMHSYFKFTGSEGGTGDSKVAASLALPDQTDQINSVSNRRYCKINTMTHLAQEQSRRPEWHRVLLTSGVGSVLESNQEWAVLFTRKNVQQGPEDGNNVYEIRRHVYTRDEKSLMIKSNAQIHEEGAWLGTTAPPLSVKTAAPSTSSTSESSSNFLTVFISAVKAYEKKTKTDLLTHPLAAQLQSCNSSSDILAILNDKVNEFEQFRSGNERLSSWLNPTINVLYAFSVTLGGGVGLIFSPANVISAGVGVLLMAAIDVSASEEALSDLFERIENFFKRLESYTEVPPTEAMADMIVKIMVEVLNIFAIATKEMKQGRASSLLPGSS